MTAPHALVRMRYRPSADVLVGQVELRDADPQPLGTPGELDAGELAVEPTARPAHVEQLDADTSLTWRTPEHGPCAGRWVLQGFQVVGVGARLGQGRSPLEVFLSERLTRTALELITSATSAAASLAAGDRVRARAEAEVEVPVAELVRPQGAPHLPVEARSSVALSASTPPEVADLGAARALSAAVVHLADAVDGELSRRSRRRDDPEPHATRFVRALRTLAEVVSRHRLPAPGAAAAAIESVRGGLPLSSSERALLRTALTHTDHVHTWRAAARDIEALAASIDADHGPRRGERR